MWNNSQGDNWFHCNSDYGTSFFSCYFQTTYIAKSVSHFYSATIKRKNQLKTSQSLTLYLIECDV